MAADTFSRTELTEIAELLKDIDICMLVTRSDGTLHGRPMSNNGNVEYDGDSWFFSFRDTPKVAEIEADPRVELAYIATDKGTWISIEGRAEVVEDEDRKRELWVEDLDQWFPDGPDDERVVLIKAAADTVHVWGEQEVEYRRGQEPIRREAG